MSTVRSALRSPRKSGSTEGHIPGGMGVVLGWHGVVVCGVCDSVWIKGIYNRTCLDFLFCGMASKQNKCVYDNCRNRVTIGIGDCTYCQKRFCIAHHLPEIHACTGICLCKQVATERNTANLLACKCVGSKI
jgi:hypothetical protein